MLPAAEKHLLLLQTPQPPATPPTPHVTLQPFANRLDPLPPSSLATFPLATYRRSLPFSPECMSLPFVFAFAQKLNCTGEQFN